MESPINSSQKENRESENINAQGLEKKPDSENEALLRPIRTYEEDVANLVKNQKISTAKIVLAEQKKRQSEQYKVEDTATEKPKNKITKIIISLILFGLGITALFFVIQMNLIPQAIKNVVPNFGKQELEIISKENSIKILTTRKTNSEIQDEISRKINDLSEESLDQVIEFVIQKPEQTPEGEPALTTITSNNFLNIINSNTSDRFKRSLRDEFLFAVYTDSKPIPFIILKTNDINLSFSEIFGWESRMYNDLSSVLVLKPEVPDFIKAEVLIATSTEENLESGTSTPKTEVKVFDNPEPKFDPLVFSDIVISNKDSRAILGERGKVILIYSFIDEENLLITSDLKVFQQIVKRLSAQKLLR